MHKDLSRSQGKIRDQKNVLNNNNKADLTRNRTFLKKFEKAPSYQNLGTQVINPFDSLKDSFGYLKSQWREIAKEPAFGANLASGLTVAAVALPLNLALAIAAGLPASTGLIAGGIGGAFAAIFGGSRFQATGPAAALNVLVLAIVQQFGAVGAAAAALIVGALQILLSVFSAGKLIKYVPEAVLVGFTSGVGIKLLDTQLPKVFGIEWDVYDMAGTLMNPVWLHEVAWPSVVCGLFVVFFILACKSFQKFPAALVGIGITTYLAVFLDWPIHRVGEIPPVVLNMEFPQLTGSQWWQLLQLTLSLALLSAVESLLSAQAIDRISGDRHHSSLEVLGQGIGNLASGFFGGMPVSGVIVRSTVSVQSGAKNRLGNVFHAFILILSALHLGEFLSVVPIAALAGLLCIIGFRLIEVSEFFHFMRHERVKALAFVFAMVGTLTNHIMAGLALGLVVIWLADRFAEDKKVQTTPHKTDVHIQDPVQSAHPTANYAYRLLDKGEQWIQHLKAQAQIPNSAYVHPNASVIGQVVLGRNVHIAAETSIRADEGTPFYLGDNTNVQDGVVIHALKKKWIRVHDKQWAVYVGSDVSLAHQALVHGPCYIGEKSFVGFKAVVHDSIVGKGCYIGIGAVVVGVELADERYVPHGAVIDTPEKAKLLGRVSANHQHFNEDVVEVNRGLVEAYKELEALT